MIMLSSYLTLASSRLDGHMVRCHAALRSTIGYRRIVLLASHYAIGQILDGKYEIVGLLGRGGFGSVYLALQLPVGRKVAVKVINASRADDPQVAERFFREARVLALLTDPATVTLHDYGETEGGLLYMVQEYVEGPTLKAYLRERGQLPPDEAAAILLQLLHALEDAHAHGVVHRDIKPGNVILTVCRRGTRCAKLLDFGIAHIAGQMRLTFSGGIVGSPSYISPEQIGRREVGPAADLYALGVVFYEMLAGRRPFDAPDMLARLKQHVTERPPPLPDSVPRALAAIVARAMQKKPSARHADAAAMRRAIDDWLADARGSATDAFVVPGAEHAPWSDGAEADEVGRGRAPLLVVAVIALGAVGWVLAERGAAPLDRGATEPEAAGASAQARQTALPALDDSMAIAFLDAEQVDAGRADAGLADAGLQAGPADVGPPDAAAVAAAPVLARPRVVTEPSEARLRRRVTRWIERCECGQAERDLVRLRRVSASAARDLESRFTAQCMRAGRGCKR